LFGRVLYLNGQSPNRPLDVIRYGLGYPYGGTVGFHVWAPQVIVPHYNYQDQPDWIAFEAGQQHTCLPAPNHSDCADYRLPDAINAFLHNGTWPVTSWLGTTLNGVTESQGSGLQYMANRFYDPVNGTFTQQDPIGLGGGLNAYGFAGGDPTSYRDPQGTCGPFCVVAVSVGVMAVVGGGTAIFQAWHNHDPVTWGLVADGVTRGALSGLVGSVAVFGGEALIGGIIAATASAPALDEATDAAAQVATSPQVGQVLQTLEMTSPPPGSVIALGIKEGGQLADFASKVGADPYWAWPEQSGEFSQQFMKIAGGSSKIFFNLDGVNIGRALQLGAAGLQGGSGMGWTEWELYQIATQPGWLARTIFYLNGSPISTPGLLLH
jgi:RHS repeat-associated protein